MSNDGVEAGESVPNPTTTPASRSSVSGATPQPSSAFDRGQCATGTPRSARSGTSSGATSTQWAQRSSGPSTGSMLATGRSPVGGTTIGAIAWSGPEPLSSHSVSCALSARCVPTGTPSDRQNRYVSSEQV